MGHILQHFSVIFFLAGFIRWWLVTSEFQKEIAARIEIATPINSMRRVIEGRYRAQLGLNPYDGDLLHESSVHLKFYTLLLDTFESNLQYFLIVVDLLTAYFLYLFTQEYMISVFRRQEQQRQHYSIDANSQLLRGRDIFLPPFYVCVVYLFNPYSIFNCVAMTTTVIHNFFLALFFYGIVYNNIAVSVVTLALATTQSFYPIVLISPLYLSIYNKRKSHGLPMLATAAYFSLIAGILYAAKDVHNGWGYLENTFGFILGVSDQQPNIGVYWYFFMEMFEHFRLLFLYSYQLNVTVLYFIPLSVKFRKDPSLLAACFIMLIAIFKSYPSVGDFGFTLALMPCWTHLYNCMQQIFISSITVVVTTALAPILWDLWIFWGTANANFFFGATLAFITAHIFLVTDISFAYTKREYLLKYGNYRKINGKTAKLVLE